MWIACINHIIHQWVRYCEVISIIDKLNRRLVFKHWWYENHNKKIQNDEKNTDTRLNYIVNYCNRCWWWFLWLIITWHHDITIPQKMGEVNQPTSWVFDGRYEVGKESNPPCFRKHVRASMGVSEKCSLPLLKPLVKITSLCKIVQIDFLLY